MLSVRTATYRRYALKIAILGGCTLNYRKLWSAPSTSQLLKHLGTPTYRCGQQALSRYGGGVRTPSNLAETKVGDICGILSAHWRASILIDTSICGFSAAKSPFLPTSGGHCEAFVSKFGVKHPQISSGYHISGNHPEDPVLPKGQVYVWSP
jgi:hypothetical protein